MTLQRGLIFSAKYTRWEKGWYYLKGSYQMGRKTHKTSNLSPRNPNNFYYNFFFYFRERLIF